MALSLRALKMYPTRSIINPQRSISDQIKLVIVTQTHPSLRTNRTPCSSAQNSSLSEGGHSGTQDKQLIQHSASARATGTLCTTTGSEAPGHPV
eukprot:744177-Hanusia_phi.AAC.3